MSIDQDGTRTWDHMARVALGTELRAAAQIHAADPRHIPAPHIQWVISKGTEGAPGHLPPEALEMADAYWLYLIDALAARYPLETELTARQAASAATLAEGGDIKQWSRLTPAQQHEREAALHTFSVLAWLLAQWPHWPEVVREIKSATAAGVSATLDLKTQRVVMSDAAAAELEAIKARVTPEDVAVAEAIMTRLERRTPDGRRSYSPPSLDDALLAEFPSGRRALDTIQRLQPDATLSPQEVATELDKLLVLPNGTRRPTLQDWLEAQGLRHLTARVHQVIERRAHEEDLAAEKQRADEANRRAEEERRARKEAERRAEQLERDKKQWQQHGAFTRYPLMTIDNMTGGQTWRAEQLTFFNDTMANGQLETAPEREALAHFADVNPVHWNLSVPEWRILHGVYSLYSHAGVTGDTYGAETVPEDWGQLYLLGGIREYTGNQGRRRSPKRQREMKDALNSLTARRVPVFLSFRKPNGRWEVAAPEVQLLERIPMWSNLSNEENTRLRATSPELWPEPSAWHLRIPVALRRGLNSYFREVPTDLWARLEEAADGQTGNAFRLALKLYQQPPGTSPTVRLSRETLIDALPVLAGFAHRRQWSRVEKAVSDAGAVLYRAGLLQGAGRWQKGQKGGHVFVCERNPAAFPMLAQLPLGVLEGTVSGAQGTVSGAQGTVSGAQGTVSGAQGRRKSRKHKQL